MTDFTEFYGRILKKYSYSKYLIFYDFLFYNTTKLNYEISSLVINLNDEDIENNNLNKLKLTAGDVVKVYGKIQKNDNQMDIENYQEKPSIFITNILNNIIKIEEWNDTKLGFFNYDSNLFYNNKNLIIKKLEKDLVLPTLAIQVKLKQMERFLSALQDSSKYFIEKNGKNIQINEDNYRVGDWIIRCSSTNYLNNSDRLLLLFYSPLTSTEVVWDDIKELISKIINDKVLQTGIVRLYPGNSHQILMSEVNVSLKDLISNFYLKFNKKFLQNDTNISCRLHLYPKSLITTVLGHFDEAQQELVNKYSEEKETFHLLPWKTQNYSHIISICFIDGVWFLALYSSEHAYIGDFHPNSTNSSSAPTTSNNSKIQLDTTAINTSICRAGAKIEEILRRNQWLNDFQVDYAIDVGSSPGGWTQYLAASLNINRVVSVDKGELLIPQPWCESIEYFPMIGNDAIDYLIEEKKILENPHSNEDIESLKKIINEKNIKMATFRSVKPFQIDLFCCDANIEPIVSIKMLRKCIENNLMSPKSRFIITLKNIYGKKAKWDQSIEDCKQELEDLKCKEISFVHLLANTSKETTITGKVY